MSNYPGNVWTCRFCGRMDNRGDVCPSCGATRSQSVDPSTPQQQEYLPVMPPISAPAARPRSPLLMGCALIFGIILLLAGLCVSTVAVSEWNDFRVLSESGTTTKATVTSRYTTSSGLYYINYSFKVNGEVFDDKDTANAGTYNNAEPGTEITIRYAKSDPTVSHIGLRDSNDIAAIITVMGVCLDGVALILLVFAVRRLSRRRAAR